MSEQPKQYRLLQAGEIIQEGDEFYDWEGWSEAYSIGRTLTVGDNEFRREIKPEPIASRWQSMDTAPKDGTWILAWYRNRGRAEMARWESEIYHKKPKPYWHTAFLWGVIENRNNPPSHWQPLPEGPTE